VKQLFFYCLVTVMYYIRYEHVDKVFTVVELLR
jgi:hypothetical protein